jgi:hypothetical protein
MSKNKVECNDKDKRILCLYRLILQSMRIENGIPRNKMTTKVIGKYMTKLIAKSVMEGRLL